MDKNIYKYIKIDGISIAYTDTGSGQPMLFVHGFASFSYTWQKLITLLPSDLRYIAIDLKGYGFSDKISDDKLTPFDQANILIKFSEKLNLKNIVLVGHSMGGAISLLSLFNKKYKKKVSRLILIDCAGLFYNFPNFIEDILGISPNNFLMKNIDEEKFASLVLEKIFFDKEKIPKNTHIEYGNILKQENAKKCLKKAAEQISISNVNWFVRNIKRINKPSLIIWGREDSVVYIEDSIIFKANLDAILKIIPYCGHIPQEEKPEETAKTIINFLNGSLDKSKPALTQNSTKPLNHGDDENNKLTFSNNSLSTTLKHNKDRLDDIHSHRKLKMRRLFDKWRFDTVILMLIIKMLQTIKKFGLKAEENGWRKFAGVFLQKEHSKFMLTSFRLTPFKNGTYPNSLPAAKAAIIKKLISFIRENTVVHWSFESGIFRARGKRVYFTDIIEGVFNNDGTLASLIPYFDNSRVTFTKLTDNIISIALEKLIEIYNKNELKGIKDSKRPKIIKRKLLNWAHKTGGLSYLGRRELIHLIKRILNSTFIHFEELPLNKQDLPVKRFATPNVYKRRHMGYGLLNIVCKLKSDFSEADLWFQYHHVPVDGMPMEEMLEKLKSEWGTAGKTLYPATNSDAFKPELLNYGDNVYRGKLFIEFEKLIKIRKYLNSKYYNEMGGPATISSLIIWGISQRKYFRNTKFVVTTETDITVDFPQDRNIGLVFIRPGSFLNENDDKLQCFFNFQREMNHRIFATRFGKSETSELLEIYAMIHPLFFHLTRFFLPKAMREMIGTAGLTILKDVEVFISPLTDLQINGFVAIGNMKVATEDNKTAGSVSFCAGKNEINEYVNAFRDLINSYPSYLDIKEEELIY